MSLHQPRPLNNQKKHEGNTHAAAQAKISYLLAFVIIHSTTENFTMNIRNIATLMLPDAWRKYKRTTGMVRANAEIVAVSISTMKLVRALE